MKIAKTRAELDAALNDLHGSRALVMTMGALHEGHLSLVKAAREAALNVIVSIYVNPLQFAPGEDFEAYPRNLNADVALLDTIGVEVVFAPSDAEMYPQVPLVRIDPGPVAARFEGKTRPTHFAGVLQVVHKVLNLVQPDIAFFGQKDAQQLALIRTMVRDLDMPVEIRSVPIKRAEDGLALSSRNAYLTTEERTDALALWQALHRGRNAAQKGASARDVIETARRYLMHADGVKLDYLAGVNPQTFEEITDEEYTGSMLLATAAWVGNTRLIDNLEVVIQ